MRLVIARQFHGGDVRQPPARAQPFFLVQHTAQEVRRVEHTLHEYPGFPAAHRAHGLPQRRRGIGGMAEFGPAFDARLFNQRAYNRLITVQDNVGQPFIQSHARGFHGFTVRVRHAHHCPGHGLHLSISSEKCCSMKRLLWKKAGIREKECSLRTAFRPPPWRPFPHRPKRFGRRGLDKNFLLIYCFY